MIAAMLRDSSWLACVGIVDGRFVVPTIVTPLVDDLLARAGELAVAAGLRREVDDHRAGPHPAHRLRRHELRRRAGPGSRRS